MGLIPKPGSRNEKGEPIDVLESIRGKKDLATLLLPELYRGTRESRLYAEDEDDAEAMDSLLRTIERVAGQMGIPLID